MLRRFSLLVAGLLLLAPASFGQGTRARKVQERPAAAVRPPQPAAPAGPASFASIPFASGETLNYNVEWNNNGTAATVVLKVGERKSYFGNDALPLSANIATVGMVKLFANVQIQFTSYSSPKTVLPFRTESSQTINGKSDSSTVVFDRGKNVAVVGESATPVAPDAGDMLSLIYRLRAMPLRLEDSGIIEGFDGKRKFQVRYTVEAAEQAPAVGGPVDALRVALFPIRNGAPSDAMKIRVWYSADAKRLPMLVTAQPDFGAVKMMLAKSAGVRK